MTSDSSKPDSTGSGEDARYWWSEADEHQPGTLAFGDDTAQVVDEQAGGAVLYCHADNAQAITDALNAAHTHLIQVRFDRDRPGWVGSARTTIGEDVFRLSATPGALADMLDTATTIATRNPDHHA